MWETGVTPLWPGVAGGGRHFWEGLWEALSGEGIELGLNRPEEWVKEGSWEGSGQGMGLDWSFGDAERWL